MSDLATGSVGPARRLAGPLVALATILLACALVPGGNAQAERRKPSFVPEDQLEKLDTAKFTSPTKITNRWLPMTPGTRYVYDGTTEENGVEVAHQIVINITDLVKNIAGVDTLVSYDLDYTKGQVVEAELAFYAQDDAGNVWHFGQYPEEYVNGKFDNAPAWLPGIHEARAGIMMKAAPALGTPSYSQGYGPRVNWTDRGQTYQMGQSVDVGGKRYSDVLVIRESSLEEEEIDAAQLKYYSQGVGNIKVGWMGSGEKSKEVLELTRIEQLDAQEMATVRQQALDLEKSAYRHSRSVYARTAPMKQLGN